MPAVRNRLPIAARYAPDFARSLADRFREAGSDTSDAQLAQILLLAAEGLRFLDMLNLLPDDITNRQQLFTRLLELSRNLPR